MAEQLRGMGWRNTPECLSKPTAETVDELRAVRLFPPGSNDYFVEFLADTDQPEAKRWIPLKLSDGWYGLPCFRFLGIASLDRIASDVGLEYACPSMMALANLLSHPVVGTVRIASGDMRGVLRSAKDLGRVIALARLEGREGTENWLAPWRQAVQKCFPKEARGLLANLGVGLEEMLADINVLEDARKTTEIGLLNGMQVSAEMLQATGERLLLDVIRPLREEAAA
jgi:hypothetical protein